MRRVAQHYDAEVGKTGLKGTQYSLLSYVYKLGPIRPGDLARLDVQVGQFFGKERGRGVQLESRLVVFDGLVEIFAAIAVRGRHLRVEMAHRKVIVSCCFVGRRSGFDRRLGNLRLSKSSRNRQDRRNQCRKQRARC